MRFEIDRARAGFSALQRAENSSIGRPRLYRRRGHSVSVLFSEPKIPQSYTLWFGHRSIIRFQCSSASRKFLNSLFVAGQASEREVSVLFSEPKIPQFVILAKGDLADRRFQCSSASRKFLNLVFNQNKPAFGLDVSVLFSEPKIPQFRAPTCGSMNLFRFSALQRAENSSIWAADVSDYVIVPFQCSSASRKFLNRRSTACIT